MDRKDQFTCCGSVVVLRHAGQGTVFSSEEKCSLKVKWVILDQNIV